MSETKPNIVLFVPDSYRGDVLGHLGNAGAVTPNLDALVAAGEAVSFRQAFSQSPVCTPSRCSFMPGWYPHVHGHRSMKNMLKDHEPHLLKTLRRAGYHVWWGGKNDLAAVEKPEDYLKHCDVKYRPQKVEDSGYRLPPLAADDRRHGAFYRGVAVKDGDGVPFNHGDRVYVDGALEVIRNRPEEKPFCLYLPLTAPHPAYAVEKPFYDRIDPAKLPPRLPIPSGGGMPPVFDAMRKAYGVRGVTEEDWAEIRRVYYAMCCRVDEQFGQVVRALKEQGLYDDTLILFWSDHGDFTGDYSLPEKTHVSLQDALVHVPLVIKPPKNIAVKAGIRDRLVELLDIPATLHDLLDIDPGYTVQGQSLRKPLMGDESGSREAVFAEVGSRRDERVFKNLDVKAMAPDSFYGRQSSAVLPYHDEGTYAVMCRTERYKYVRRAYTDYHELYDLEQDPGELNNLAGRPDAAALETEFRGRLLDFFMQTGDVLPWKQDSRKI